ncbi:hypothetical protein [Burkholderia territorii]|nr:hypothetical protein [Burkholderia territorii]
MGAMNLPLKPSGEAMPYDAVLTLLRNTGCIKRVADSDAYVANFKAIVHVLLTQYLSQEVCAVATVAYEDGLRAGLAGAEPKREALAALGKRGARNCGVTKGFLEMVSRAGCTHGQSIRQEYQLDRLDPPSHCNG